MTNPYPPPPRRLTRSTSDRVIGGVCGGLAQYLNMDPNLVRILTVLISLFTGVPVLLYVLALFVVPEDTAVPSAPPHVGGPPPYPGGFSAAESGTPAPAYAPYPGGAGAGQPPRPGAADPVWGNEGPPWEQPQSAATATPPVADPLEPEAPMVPPGPQTKPADDLPRT